MADGGYALAAELGLDQVVLKVRKRMQLRRLLGKHQGGRDEQVAQSTVHLSPDGTKCTPNGLRALLLPVESLLLLPARLRLHRKGRGRACDQPRDADRL